MKLCILGDNGSTHIQKWVKAISDHKDINLHVISFDKGVEFDGVSYHPLKRYTRTKLDYFLNAFTVKSCVRRIKPDLIHAHYATSNGFLAAFSGFHPCIITGWGADIFDSPKNFFMNRVLRYALSKADAITVLSQITLKEISKYTNKSIQIIPFGVDVSMFSSSQKNNDGIIRIGTIRTLSEKYGIEYLIRAFAQLAPRHNTIRLEIIGDGEQKEYLKSLTEKLHISDKVTFHGFVSQTSEFEKYISILRSFDIFAILSIQDSETFGVAAVEASACGIPVIATNVGGLPEVVESEKTGIIVPPKNIEATTAALGRLIESEDIRITMGNNGKKNARERYNWRTNIHQMINLYRDIFKNRTLIREKAIFI